MQEPTFNPEFQEQRGITLVNVHNSFGERSSGINDCGDVTGRFEIFFGGGGVCLGFNLGVSPRTVLVQRISGNACVPDIRKTMVKRCSTEGVVREAVAGQSTQSKVLVGYV
jgi:hypothetical protein